MGLRNVWLQMPLDEILDDYTDTENLQAVGSIVGGYVVADVVANRVVDTAQSSLGGLDLPPETPGLVTAAAFYGYGDQVFDSMTARHMAYGGLLNSVDEFAGRPAVRNALPF